MARSVVENVSSLGIILRLEVLVDKQAPAVFHQECLLGVVAGDTRGGELMSRIALFRIGEVVACGGKSFSEGLEIHRYAGVLPVGIRRSIFVVECDSGKRTELRAQIPQH